MSPSESSARAGDRPTRVVALDVGGTVLKGGVYETAAGPDRDGPGGVLGLRRLSALRRPTPVGAGPEAVVAAALDALAELCDRAPEAEVAGLVVPGVVDEAAGIAVESENLFWRDVPFARLAAERTGRRVAFGHDVRAGGRAELAALTAAGGPGRSPGESPRDALVMLVGTGIAALMVVAGQVVEGMFAGEIGHAPVGPEEPCACGSTGCLETISSAAAVARRYRQAGGRDLTAAPAAIPTGGAPAVTTAGAPGVSTGAREVLAAAVGGDPLARRVWDDAVGGLVRALAAYATLLTPEVVVIGGGLSLAGAALLDPIRAGLAARLTFQPRPELRGGVLGDDAGSIGAALLARDLLAR